MKMHKIILILFAATLVVIGTTGTVAYAEGPDQTPETLLTGDKLATYQGLREYVKGRLADGFIPLLQSEGFDEQSMREFLELVVQAEKDAQDRLNRNPIDDVGSPVKSKNFGTRDTLPGGLCTLAGPTFYHNSLTVSVYSSVNCTYVQYKLTSTSRLARDGYPLVDSHRQELYTRTTWSTILRIRQLAWMQRPYRAASDARLRLRLQGFR